MFKTHPLNTILTNLVYDN